jgi:hypothetical protein
VVILHQPLGGRAAAGAGELPGSVWPTVQRFVQSPVVYL